MKINFIYCLSFLLLGLLTSCKEQEKPQSSQPQPSKNLDEYQLNRLNDLEQYIVSSGTLAGYSDNDVYATLMDWNLGQGRYATLTVFIDGRTKLYTSTGAKAIDIKHQNVANEVSRYLTACTRLNHLSQRFVNTKLPEEGHYTFYFKTNGGISIGEGHMDDVKDLKSPWAALFKQANDVISEVRATYQDFYVE